MIITCPNCGTHYDIKPGAIKPTGSMMRCARCHYTWQQSVIHAVEVREQQMTIPAEPALYAQPQAAAPPPPPPPPPPPAPEPMPEPMPEPEPEPMPEPEPEPMPEPEPEPEPVDEEPLSQDELDDLFGPDDAPTDGLESMIGDNIDDDEAETITIEDDETETEAAPREDLELDDIPETLTQTPHMDDDEIPVGRPQFKRPPEPQKKPIGKIIAFTLVSLIVASALTIVLAKETIMEMYPPAQDYYVMAGLYTPEVGEGLTHKDVKPRRDVRDGIDYLIIEGLVENITEKPVAVPLLKAALTNVSGKEIRVITKELGVTQLQPGETVPFEVEFENPPGTARSMSLGFAAAAAPMEDGAADGAGEH